jgi:hypothetical protein
MTPFETYQRYISLKNHFSKDTYDFFKYGGKSKISINTYNKRRDRYFFEKISRKYSKKEITEYFVSNFISSDNPSGVWIGEIIQQGEKIYTTWKTNRDRLAYNFEQESKSLLEESNIPNIFDCSTGHPIILKKYLAGKLSLELMVIYDMIFNYVKNFDKSLLDPVWDTISKKIKKYRPFINIDIFRYKKILRDIVYE